MTPREQLASASMRHLEDALHLGAWGPNRSLDQAWHLAGFAAECAWKASVSTPRYHRIVGHGFYDHDLLAFIQSLEPLLERGAQVPPSFLDSWNPNHRYEATGTRLEAQVVPFVDATGRFSLDLLERLWVMGLLGGESI